MDSNNQNEDAKSKIEKIRIDLEKKLAALEAVKLKSTNKGNSSIEKTDDIVEEKNTSNVNEEAETNRSFIEQISDIENSSNLDNFKIEENKEVVIDDLEEESIVVTEKKEISEEELITPTTAEEKIVESINDETLFEITDEIENIEVESVALKEEPLKEKKMVAPIIAAAKVSNNIKETSTETEQINKETKNSNLNYLIYALAAVVIFGVGYLGWNYFNKSSKSNDEILSEYENQKFKDSIELADAKNQLSDFISQRYIDSIANANQILLDTNSNKNTTRKNNFNSKPKNTKETIANNKLPSSNVDNQNETIISTIPVTTNLLPPNNNVVDNNVDDNSNVDNNITPNNKEDSTLEKSNTSIKSEPITTTSKIKDKPKKTETLSTIEKSPVYPGCENKSSELAKKKCLMSKVSRFVQNKFNGDLSQDLGLDAGRKKINVQFIIDKNGNATVLRVRGQHKVLEKEAVRVVNSLPKMKPGRKKGKTEPVIYNLPIIYNVEY